MSEAQERKLATILFADLVGSTARAEAEDPERTRANLERSYDTVSAEIEAAGGTVEKFAGDAVMAAFGAPEALEDHAERALHTALSMQRRVGGGPSPRGGGHHRGGAAGRARPGRPLRRRDAPHLGARP